MALVDIMHRMDDVMAKHMQVRNDLVSIMRALREARRRRDKDLADGNSRG